MHSSHTHAPTATLSAAAPEQHASVHASAGTGKTWLLVTRIVRLLLSGAAPASILAVTFTRKAAAEMLERLNERLAQLATGDDATVDATLRALGVIPDSALRDRARRLYEDLLFEPRPVRATTFHAFCQEILQRFPVEAEIPPGFDLLENEAELIEEAWDALYAEATLKPDSKPARALEHLFDACDGLANTRQALNSFLTHRIDWWAYTQHEPAALASAETRTRALFGIAPDAAPGADFFSPVRRAELREFAALLGRHNTKTTLEHQALLQQALALQEPDAVSAQPERLALVGRALLTNDGEPRKRASKAIENVLGKDYQRLLELQESLCTALLEARDLQARQQSVTVICAWQLAGQRLLDHYQRIKREQRVLDFADLEWNAYRLLNGSEQAHWVQYKLDARIDHILIDEFQDTNPTQWRLLLPLLSELAAGTDERRRSVFLVGDAKQSIYRFRRADARLLETASQWLETHLHARRYSLEASRRSSPAIIECVNRAFASGPLAEAMADFPPHTTHLTDLWGQVELLPPLADVEIASTPARTGLRNPLEEPRRQTPDDPHEREGRAIAARIRTLIDQQTLIGPAAQARPLRYGDILILLRNRTHATSYEKALREASIPYLGAARGTLLDSLEVRDLEALLNTLIAPYNDLALAQVLRSPLFAAGDTDLIALAQTPGATWMERLLALGPTFTTLSPLARAARLLPTWQTQVGHLPVHDLLDRIYHEGDVLARFDSAAPPVLKPRVRANLTSFIELALEIDSGRYPSLPHFVSQLHALRERAGDAPDDAPPEDNGAGERVRFMTVHGAKGLEAPVVFLADCGGGERDRTAWQALVDWPSHCERPAHFVLVGRKDLRDSVTRALLAAQQQAETREDANLLYVALTRARQLLFVSAAVGADTAASGWYGLLRECWDPDARLAAGAACIYTHGAPPTAAAATMSAQAPAQDIDPRLSRPHTLVPTRLRIAPSRAVHTALSTETSTDPDGRRRGIGIHRLLEWLTTPPARTRAQLLAGLARELQRDARDPELAEWLEEAEAVVQAPQFAPLFAATAYATAYTEVPLQFYQGDALVDGVIDRLLIDTTAVHIIDYKTHGIDADQTAATAQSYREQLHLYAEGVRKLWPDRRVRASILFTHCRVLVDLID